MGAKRGKGDGGRPLQFTIPSLLPAARDVQKQIMDEVKRLDYGESGLHAIHLALEEGLINVNNKVKHQNGQLRLANIKPQILEVFEITKLNKLFKILPTRAEALASY